MPSLWAVDLIASQELTARCEHVHALVAGWLERGWSEADHRRLAKPYTVAPPRPLGEGLHRLQIGLLDDDLVPVLGEGVSRALGDGVRLGRHRLRVDAPGGEPLRALAAASWMHLGSAQPASEFRFELVTPTCFRSGSLVNPLPTPSLIFGHYRSRWREFAGVMPVVAFDEVALTVTSLDLESRRVELRSRVYVGAVGSITIRAHAGSPAERAALAALARVAPFAGTGANTTAGMGVTRVEVR